MIREFSQLLFLTVLLLLLAPSIAQSSDSNVSTWYRVQQGRCLQAATGPQQRQVVPSFGACALLCSELPACIAWSFSRITNHCNVSQNAQTLRLENGTDCDYWSALHQMGHIAFWPLSNVSQTRNVMSDSGFMDLQAVREMQYVGDAVNFTGQFDIYERFICFDIKSVCLKSFTLTAWIKVTNVSRGVIPFVEGRREANLKTRLNMYPDYLHPYFTVNRPASQVAFKDPIDTSNWTYIAGVYDFTKPEAVIVVNSSHTGEPTIPPNAVSPCVDFGPYLEIGAISRTTGHNRVFQGYMKCIGLADRALTSDEIALLGSICQSANSP